MTFKRQGMARQKIMINTTIVYQQRKNANSTLKSIGGNENTSYK